MFEQSSQIKSTNVIHRSFICVLFWILSVCEKQAQFGKLHLNNWNNKCFGCRQFWHCCTEITRWVSKFDDETEGPMNYVCRKKQKKMKIKQNKTNEQKVNGSHSQKHSCALILTTHDSQFTMHDSRFTLTNVSVLTGNREMWRDGECLCQVALNICTFNIAPKYRHTHTHTHTHTRTHNMLWHLAVPAVGNL